MTKLVSRGKPVQQVEPVDAPQRRRALEPDLSFLVQAPAGSGKTGLLVQRILRLLSVVERPESMVAVTFTIKAAAEMRERVIRALAEPEMVSQTYSRQTAELAATALARDRALGWNLIDDPSRLHIQTIDALCANLVRQMPLVSDAGGIGGVVEDADVFYRQAARQALENLADGAAQQDLFRRLAHHFDNNLSALEQQIVLMLGKRDQWQPPALDDPLSPVADFSRILYLADAELREVFRQHRTVDFIEITRAAIRALGDPEAPSDLLYALDYRIEHILVDEFQDTSRAQYRLLEALTGQWSDGDGRTLFLVGDPLQSIYGFRAAEVSLFQQCWEHGILGSVRLHPLRLETNFRSTPEIVAWVQAELAPVLPVDDIDTGAVAMSPAMAARTTLGPPPQLISLIDDRDGSEEADEVVHILRRQSLQAAAETAILVRSRSHVVAILRTLRRAGIDYQAVEIDPLNDQPHILDLLALARALTHLADRAAWLACLRAPWCGLTLADLSAVAEGHPRETIFDLLSDPQTIAQLSPDGRFRAVRFQQVFAAALDRVGRISFRDLLESTWLTLGGPAILPAPHQLEDAETFFALVAELETGGIVRDFATLTDRCAKLYARPNTAENCVRVMTIHEAKGLEFETVILPRLAGTPPRDEDDLLVWNRTRDGHLEVAAQPPRGTTDPEYDRICDLHKTKEFNESKRLFYVACTRARNQLFLLGSAKTIRNGTDLQKANRLSFLGMIWDRAKPSFIAALQQATKPVQSSLFETVNAPARTISRLPARWHPPAFAASFHAPESIELGVASEPRVTYEWVGGASRHVGTVVHAVLCQIADDGVSAWSESRLKGCERAVRADLSRLGIDTSDIPSATAQAMRAVRQTLGSERGRWILQPRAGARSEWPITGVLAGRLLSGTIDRLFRDEAGRLWVIDYKTSTHAGGQLAAFLTREQGRYRAQMESYGRLLSRLEAGPVSLGLYFPLLDGWQEWPLVEAAVPAG